jgi:amino acid adenylation domain-containing protein
VGYHDHGTYAAIVASLCENHAYVPLNPRYPVARNLDCFRRSGATILLSTRPDGDLERAVTELPGIRVLSLDGLADAPLLAPRAPAPDAPAYVLFTSGSTGIPKGVPIYQRNLSSFLLAVMSDSDYAFGTEDRFLQMFDLTFDLSVMPFLCALSAGGTCCIVDSPTRNAFDVMATLEDERITVALMVPSVLALLERFGDRIFLPHLRISQFCGEALHTKPLERWAKCAPHARIFNVYGPTEATIYCSKYEYRRDMPMDEQSHLGIVCMGRPMDRVVLELASEENAAVADGIVGELFIGGAQTTDSYLGDPGRTARAFVTLPLEGRPVPVYRTGDLCIRRRDNLFYVSRADFQVKLGGFRVELADVEFHAQACVSGRAVAVAFPDAGGMTVMHLFVETSAPSDELVRQLRSALANRLPPYMIPQQIHTIATLPLNSNGKVDRPLLARMAQGV